MLFSISTLCFIYITLQFVYYTFVYLSFSYPFCFLLHITCHMFKSWHQGTVLLFLNFLLIPGPGEEDKQSTVRISRMIAPSYLTISMIVKMTIQIPMTSLFCNHPGKHYTSGHGKIYSHQHLETSHSDSFTFYFSTTPTSCTLGGLSCCRGGELPWACSTRIKNGIESCS